MTGVGMRNSAATGQGIEWGINNFLDDDLTLSREGDAALHGPEYRPVKRL